MKNYYSFTANVLLSLGIEFKKPSKFPRILAFLRYSSPFLLIICAFQCLIYFMTDVKNDYFTVQSIPTVIFATESALKNFVIAYNQDKLLKIIDRCKEIFMNLDQTEEQKSLSCLRRMRNINRNVFVADMVCIWMFNLLPFISLFVSVIRQNEVERTFPYAFWWPFDPFEYYYLIMFYHIYVGHLLMVAQNITDQYFMLIVADIASHFDRLGDRIEAVINSANNNSYSETKKKLRHCIIRHNELMQLFDTLNGIYENALLAQFLATSVIICLMGYIIMVKPKLF